MGAAVALGGGDQEGGFPTDTIHDVRAYFSYQ